MKVIECTICKGNTGKAVLDEHGANGTCIDGKILVPSTVEEWVKCQQPFLFPKEMEKTIVNVVKAFAIQFKNGLGINDFEDIK